MKPQPIPDNARNAATNYQKGKEYFSQRWKSGQVPTCSPGYISGQCTGGHKFAAPFLCGRETCPDCGRDGSPIHQRRVARWLPLVQQWQKVGYLVLTMPPGLRWILSDREALTDFRYQFRRKLKRDGHTSGLIRWHWYGDCTHCNAKGCKMCDHTGSGNTWHPHLNVLIEGGYRSDLKEWTEGLERWQRNYCLKKIREEIKKRDLLIEKYGIHLDHLDTVFTELDQLKKLYAETTRQTFVIHYSYTSNPKEITNRLKYVLRSTFRRYNAETQRLLYNYRNSIRYGFKPVKIAREQLLCDLCKHAGQESPVNWHKLTPYNTQHYEHTGNGIYRLAERGQTNNGVFLLRPPGHRNSNPGLLPRCDNPPGSTGRNVEKSTAQ